MCTLSGLPGNTLTAFICSSPNVAGYLCLIRECDSAFALAMLPGLATLLQQFGDQPCPARLMACAHASPRVSVEVFMELNQIVPVSIPLERFDALVHRPLASAVAQENAG